MPQRFEGSKKEKAFELFRQGYEPKSPEVKALKLDVSSRYKYYSEWQDGGSPGSAISSEAKVKAGAALTKGKSIGSFTEPELETEKSRLEEEKPKVEDEKSKLIGEV